MMSLCEKPLVKLPKNIREIKKLNERLILRTRENLAKRFDIIPSRKIFKIFQKNLGIIPVKISPITEGIGAVSYLVQTKNSDGSCKYVIKVSVFKSHHTVIDEFIFNYIVKRYAPSIPVPRMLLLDISFEDLSWPYMIYAWIEGKSLYSLAKNGDKNVLNKVETMGHILARIHGIHINVEGFGKPCWEDIIYILQTKKVPNPLCCNYSSYKDYYESIWKTNLDFVCSKRLIDRDMARIIKNLFNDAMPSIKLHPTMLHNDPTTKNFIFHNSTFVGLLDGSIRFGYNLEDLMSAIVFLALLSMRTNILFRKLTHAFFRGYNNSTYTYKSGQIYAYLILRLLSRIKTAFYLNLFHEINFYKHIIESIVYLSF